MIRYSSKILLTVLLGLLVYSFPAPKTEAMEPISIAMMAAPIVIPIVKAALPYIIKGAVNMAGAMFEVGLEMCKWVLIPVGFFEMTFGAPFGFFQPGLKNLVEGGVAMPMTFVKMCAVPLKTVGML